MNREVNTISPEMQMLINNKESGYNYRQRKSLDWDENYELYRDKVIVNRLTQRQSVNIPLMKTEIRTLLKDVDDMPVLYFENLDNDKQAELFKNKYWEYTVTENKMELQDIVDKRQVFLFGRSYDQWQIVDGKIKMTVQDPMDILVSRYIDPFNIHSSRFLIHPHIFVPLSSLENNTDYDQTMVAELKAWYGTEMGLIKAASNQQMLTEKNKKLADMGVQDIDNPVLGETVVELTLNFVFRDNEKNADGTKIDTQIYLYVTADDMKILMKKPLEEVIGITKDHFWRNHYPYVSWADDLERQDWYSDAIADIIRTPNKILNAFFSQLVENRSLRNLNMHFYNSNLENFNPQTWQPIPFGFYGVPVPANGDIRTVMQPVPIADLTESLDEMQFIITMTEKGTGATSTQQGTTEAKQVTLGQVQLMLSEAKGRIKGMSKFYTPAWKERGLIFNKLIEAAPEKLDAVTIYTKGRNTNKLYAREIAPKDWMTASGYNVKVWSQDEKDSQDTQAINKVNALKSLMPDNPKVDEILKRKAAEFAGCTPEEVNDIMHFEEEKVKAMISNPAGVATQPGVTGGAPTQTQPQPQPSTIQKQMQPGMTA